MLKDKTNLGSAILLFAAASLALIAVTSPAQAVATSPGSAPIGVAFNGSQSAADLPKSGGKSVMTVLGIGTNGLSLQAPKNSTSDTMGIFALDGAGTVFKNDSPGKGPQETIPGELKGIKGLDLCVSSCTSEVFKTAFMHRYKS